MRRMKFLQAFIIMMFALVFAGKGNEFAAEGEVVVEVETKDGYHEMRDSGDTTFKGLTWDGSKNVLTLDNYDGGYFRILNSGYDVSKCTVVVKGKNTMKAFDKDDRYLIRFYNVDATITGSGTIDMTMSDEKTGVESCLEQESGGSITIDGPVINMKKSTSDLIADNLYIKSGSINIERIPDINVYGNEADFSYYSAVYVKKSLIMEGGSINIDYVYPKGYNNVRVYFIDDYAIYMDKPAQCYLGGGTIDFKVADELKNLVKLTRKERSVSFFFEGDGNEYTNLDTIKGLSWDEKNFVLTMDGYDGTAIHIESNFVIEDIDVVVKGTNNINVSSSAHGIETNNINLNFIGTGSVKTDGGEAIKNTVFYMNASNKYGAILKIDGPTIDIVGKNVNPINVGKFIMNSGYLNIELYMESGKHLAAIYALYGIEINGGIITVKYEGNATNADPTILAYKSKDDESHLPGSADNCIVVLIANEQLLNILEPFGCYSSSGLSYSEPTIKVGKGVVIAKATSLDKVKIDISKLKASLSETKFVYDGKEKKPIVSIKNLVENKDYTVKYINNINPGKASAVVTGKGMFTGEIKLDFTIEEAKSEYGPAVGSKVKDSDYIYKVIKAGSKDGKVIGQVRVIGLKKKSLKKIKIANVVTIDNVKYKVTQIGAKAFKSNKKIKSVVIGKNVTTIGKQAFYNCKALKTVKINSKKLKKVGKKAFYRKGGKKLTIKVPKKSKKKYKKILKKAKTNKYVVK